MGWPNSGVQRTPAGFLLLSQARGAAKCGAADAADVMVLSAKVLSNRWMRWISTLEMEAFPFMAVGDHQRRLLGGVLSSIQRCRSGAVGIQSVQSAVEGARCALDGETPQSIREIISATESRLEYIRFCCSDQAQKAEAEPILNDLEAAINTYLGPEETDGSKT